MKIFTIDKTNNITVHTSVEDAEAVVHAERFRNEQGLAKLATDWPATRLVEIWNSLPGVGEVAKFKDRATGVSRIWKALQTLGENPEERKPEPETAAEPDATVAAIAPQSPDVATAEPAPENEAAEAETPARTAPIDKEKCNELLQIAALAQSEYWTALRELETAIGFEIDDPGDLKDIAVDDLVAQNETRRNPKTRTKASRGNSKTSQVIAMLKREGGVTLEEIMTAMKWQKHTTRAMLSAGGSLVKNHGLVIESNLVGEKRVYSIRG
jgi:hypothetical protein